MKILDKVTGAVKTFQQKQSAKKEQANREVLNTKRKYLPQIKNFARKFEANVEAYDTKAYVSKTIGGREVGVTISYGESPTNIRLKMDRAFTQKPLASRVLRGVKKAAQRGKEIREELGQAGEAIKGAVGDGSGNMYNNPDFGGQFSAPSPRVSRGGKRGKAFADDEESDTHGSSLYPEIRWG